VDQGQTVRFREHDRGGAWKKNELAQISRVLSRKPRATDDIYLVEKSGKLYWCVGADIESFNQLSLF
jgi:hypothetical protein